MIDQMTGQVTDPPRKEQRYTVRVECDADSQVLPGGHLVRRADNPTTLKNVYESDVAKIEELVETDLDAVARATEMFEVRLDRHIKAQTKIEEYNETDRGRQLAQQMRRQYGESVQSVFLESTGRHIRPLRKVECVEGPFPPPPEADPNAAMLSLIESMAYRVVSHMSPQHQKAQGGKR